MKIWFKNAQILTQSRIQKGDVLVENETIVFVGTLSESDFLNINEKDSWADRIIDVKNNVLMPGFVNAHAHTPSTILRGIADDMPLDEWLERIVPYEEMLSDEDVYYSTLLGLAEYAMAGITTVEENFSNLEAVVKAYKDSGLKARISIGYPNVNQKELEEPLIKQLELVENSNLVAVCYAHSIYGTSDKNFDTLNSFAKQNNLAVSVHMSETLKEVGDCSVSFNKTPVEYLEDLGFFDRKATVYHCVHVDKDDIAILSNYEVNVVTCPSSNLKLASGIAPIYAMQNQNINIAIGTDGAYSNNSYDMFKEMFLVATLNKATLYNAGIISAKEVLDMATCNGAKALGFEYETGQIKAGYKADIILVDIQGIHHQPQNDIISNLVYSAKSSDVYFTMVNGKIIYENKKLNFAISLDKIISKCKQISQKLKTNGGKYE